MNDVITCEGLVFSYDGQDVLRGMDFTVAQGEVFALLGPNGAGKTTTIRVLNGLLCPKKGQSRVLGFDPVSQGAYIREQTGVLTETPALYERLTAWQNLNFFGSLAGLNVVEIEERGGKYLDLFELSGRAGDRVETYSKGMKQRLALARALLHNPQLLFLDEPTTGMDPAAAKQVESLIYNISKSEGRSVVLCTHRLYEAEKVCDRVAVMKKGVIIESGSLVELRNRIAPQLDIHFTFSRPPQNSVSAFIKTLKGVTIMDDQKASELKVRVRSEQIVPKMVKLLVEHDVSIQSVVPHKATLEEIYLQLQESEGKA